MAIMDWPSEQRPREKLLAQGPAALSDAELLAVLLRTGVAGRNAVELAMDCLTRFGSLAGLLAAPLAEFRGVPGLGEVKFIMLQAVRELGKRVVGEGLRQSTLLARPAAVREYLLLHLAALEHEVFLGLFLDPRCHLIATVELFRGSLTETNVYPREVVKAALAHNAASVIFAHNHPSGVAVPSAADRAITDRLTRALALIEVKTLDHFIVGGNQVCSLHAGQLV